MIAPHSQRCPQEPIDDGAAGGSTLTSREHWRRPFGTAAHALSGVVIFSQRGPDQQSLHGLVCGMCATTLL